MLYPYNRGNERILTATSSAHFLTNDVSVSITRSPGLSSSLQWLGTSDISPKKVHVATYLFGFLLGKYMFIRLLPGKSA